MKHKELVRVSIDSDKSALLIKDKTGVVYQQQANGVCCDQYEEEGILIDLELDISDFCCGIDYSSFDVVSKINRRIQESNIEKQTGFRVVVKTGNNGVEAWLPVVIKRVKNKNKYKHLPNKAQGFLLWNNCD